MVPHGSKYLFYVAVCGAFMTNNEMGVTVDAIHGWDWQDVARIYVENRNNSVIGLTVNKSSTYLLHAPYTISSRM